MRTMVKSSGIATEVTITPVARMTTIDARDWLSDHEGTPLPNNELQRTRPGSHGTSLNSVFGRHCECDGGETGQEAGE